jgi:hypothetical protein
MASYKEYGNMEVSASTLTGSETIWVRQSTDTKDLDLDTLKAFIIPVVANNSIVKTSNTGSAVMPVGLASERDASPSSGYFRQNANTQKMEFYNGTSWKTLVDNTTNTSPSANTIPISNPNGLLDDWLSKTVIIQVSDPSGNAITTGDGKAFFTVPVSLNGCNIIDVDASLTTASTSGTPTIQIRNVTDSQDVLSTRITVDANEKTSYTASTQPVINTSYDDVSTGDQLAVDIDVAGTGAKGLSVILIFKKA